MLPEAPLPPGSRPSLSVALLAVVEAAAAAAAVAAEGVWAWPLSHSSSCNSRNSRGRAVTRPRVRVPPWVPPPEPCRLAPRPPGLLPLPSQPAFAQSPRLPPGSKARSVRASSPPVLQDGRRHCRRAHPRSWQETGSRRATPRRCSLQGGNGSGTTATTSAAALCRPCSMMRVLRSRWHSCPPSALPVAAATTVCQDPHSVSSRAVVPWGGYTVASLAALAASREVPTAAEAALGWALRLHAGPEPSKKARPPPAA
mmetsp:Transcript_21041/g.63303  ORF Transcript_21041/g.63303 Transcript_21041/m.63303 type:complete len:256 (+) Transcript_21041:3090-3857(+)